MADVFKPRVTVAAIAHHDGKYLMVEENIRGKLMLNQPAGHLESREPLLDAVIRETLEETAWHCTPQHLVGIYQWYAADTRRQFLRFCFAVELLDHEPNRPLDHGIKQAIWMTKDDIYAQQHRLRSPMITRSIESFEQDTRLPLDILENAL